MDQYLVTRPLTDSNIGSNLASLAGAAYLGRTLSRTVVVDWRGLSQLPDHKSNYFTEFLEPVPELGGAQVVYAPAAAVGNYEPGGGAAWLSPGEAHALGTGAATESARHVVLQLYHGLDRIHPGPEAERQRLLRSFYADLRPGPEVGPTAERWWAQHACDRFVVGVNVRTGNGHYFGKHGTYASRVDVSIFENRRRFLRMLERACLRCLASLPRGRRDGFAVFYATDAAWMSELLAGLPNAVTRRSVYPPPDTGDTHLFDDPDAGHASIVDTLVDMFLLARCDALIYNSSLFNQYARLLIDARGGELVHIESLFLRGAPRRVAAAVRRRLA